MRDAVNLVLSMPLTPTQAIAQGPILRELLAMPKVRRRCWQEKFASKAA